MVTKTKTISCYNNLFNYLQNLPLENTIISSPNIYYIQKIFQRNICWVHQTEMFGPTDHHNLHYQRINTMFNKTFINLVCKTWTMRDIPVKSGDLVFSAFLIRWRDIYRPHGTVSPFQFLSDCERTATSIGGVANYIRIVNFTFWFSVEYLYTMNVLF